MKHSPEYSGEISILTDFPIALHSVRNDDRIKILK